MEIVIKVTQLLLSLSILVVVHEWGHYAFARLFKTRVEKFYLFFNPWFSLVRYKKVDGKRKFLFFSSGKTEMGGDPNITEYGIGWLPLGGYVKISGMIDESMDKEQMKLPPQPHEFRAKPAWQRLLIMVGGVLVNFVLAIMIYASMLFVWGEEYLPTKNVKYGIVCDSVALGFGLQNGDKILSLDNQPVEKFHEIGQQMLLNKPSSIQVERNNEKVDIALSSNIVADVIRRKKLLFSYRIPFAIEDFTDDSDAKKSGLQKGDRLIGVNGNKMEYFDQYPAYIEKYKGQEVQLTALRNNDTLKVSAKVSDAGRLGIYPQSDWTQLFETQKIEYGFFSAIPAGIAQGYDEVVKYLKQLKLVFTPETEAYKSVGSFITMGKLFPAVWDWQSFWRLTALLSIMLAVVNILPIPALDGGHVVFLIIEIVSRRKPSEKVLEYAQMVGMVILLSIMVLALGNDFVNHVFN